MRELWRDCQIHTAYECFETYNPETLEIIYRDCEAY